MQAPNSLMTIRNRLHALTRKLMTEVLFSSLATLLTMAIMSQVTKPVSPAARVDEQLTSQLASSAGETPRRDTSEATADFMQSVALSHVASLRAPHAAESQASHVAANEPVAVATVPLPPRPPATPRRDRLGSSRTHLAANAPKAPQALPPAPAVQPPAVIEPASEPAPAKAQLMPPLDYGMHLVTNLGTIVAASETRVIEGMATVGDTLTSIVKKL